MVCGPWQFAPRLNTRCTKVVSVIMDSGAEEHVVTSADWQRLGEPLSQPAQVRLRSATGDDMEVLGGIVFRGKLWWQTERPSLSAQRSNS